MTTDGEAAANPAIKVLISYAHEDDRPQVANAVNTLCGQLRDPHGIEAIIDQHCMPSGPSEGWLQWMDRALERANFIVCVITEAWVRRVTGNEVEGRGHGVAWEGEYIYNLLYGALGDTCRVVLVRLPGDTCPPPVRLGGRHLHQLPKGLDTLVGTLRGERVDPVEVVYDPARSEASRREAARRHESVGTDGAATALEAIDPKAAVDEAVALLENLLLDASLADIVRQAVGDAPAGLAAHLRRSKASAIVNALNGLHGKFIGQSLHKEARSVDRAVRLLLPFLGDWARLVSLARRSSGAAIDLPIVDLTLAELLLAAADARPCHFTLRGAELRPTRLVLVTAARRAYRDAPTTLTRLLEQSLARRLSTANPYEVVEAVLRDTTLGDDFSELVRAVPDLPFTVPATPFRLDAETLSDLDARFTADRDNAVLEERCHWSLVIADENDLRCDELWRLVCDGLKGLEGLRLVRLSGGAAVDRKELKVSLQYLVKIMVRGHE